MKEAATTIKHYRNINTKAGKRAFVRDLMTSVRKDVLAKIAQMPENWDGIELRWYVADKFAASALNPIGISYQQKRKRDYDNEVLVRNL